jgi:serine/threonine protein phosphatase PrpC
MIWVGQFGIAAGQAREDTPWIGIFQDSDSEEEKADLYVVVEPALPGSEEFCGEMKDAIGEVFHETKASLTGGILRALRSAHENLRDWNKRSLKEHRVAAGVSCVAIHDHEAFLAQVGPARAVYAHEGQLEELSPVLPEAREALGLEDEFWPDFRRFELAPGDRLLLLSPDLASAIPERELAAVLSLDGEQALPELYRRTRGLDNAAALLIASGPPEFVAAE